MIGIAIHDFAKELWKINRSITGEGVRQTLGKISNHLPQLKLHAVKSGTQVFDWVVPQEWYVEEAYIRCPSGEKICDFSENNLHLVGYSIPIRKTVSLAELQQHLYSLPEQPNAIPYITSYYKERWGFCLQQSVRDNLVAGSYEVVITSRLFSGVLNYGELLIAGKSDKEVFISTYICHPSMANNELSGPSVVTFLCKWLLEQESLRYSYRIVFIPETIGSITYLSKNYRHLRNKVEAGFNVSCIGDDRMYSYLPSRQGNTLSDNIARHVLKWIYPSYASYDWSARGSDERQYCAPGIDLPIATIMRTKYGEYPEYHTSLDDLVEVVTPAGLQGGYEALRRALEALENNVTPRVKVYCEPHLGKLGLYPTLSTKESRQQVKVMMDLLTWSDGEHTLLEIAEKIAIPIWELYELLATLLSKDLLEICEK